MESLKTQALNELKFRAKRELHRRRAQTSLSEFVTFLNPNYLMGWVHKEICRALDQFLQDVLNGKNPRLMINLAPRHGKSELASRNFPAYAFGRNPNFNIIATSYGASLSQDMSRDVQRIIDTEDYHSIFPNTILNGSNVRTNAKGGFQRTVEKFEIVGHKGAYMSAGVGGAITGKGADILIIDDIFKSRAEAESPTQRQKVIDWYKGTAYTRLSPKSGVLIMMTRWHTDDLAGYLIEQMQQEGADQWKVINYPAIALHDELYRKAGEALHPERYPIEKLEQIRITIGQYDFDAQYQQRPYTIGGNLFKSSWFPTYEDLPPLQYRILVADTALKTSESADYSVIMSLGITEDGRVYVIDIVRGKWPSYQLRRVAVAMWEKHSALNSYQKYGVLRYFLIEDKASGTDVIQTLRYEKHIPIKSLVPITDKLTRAMDVITYCETGIVYIPQSMPWYRDFIDELEKFQANMKHAHDDQVDCLVYGITNLKIHRQGIKFNPQNLRR